VTSVLHEDVSKFFISRLVLRIMGNVSGISYRNITTYILCSITFLWKSCRLWDNMEKIWYSQTGHRWHTTAHVHYLRNK